MKFKNVKANPERVHAVWEFENRTLCGIDLGTQDFKNGQEKEYGGIDCNQCRAELTRGYPDWAYDETN